MSLHEWDVHDIRVDSMNIGYTMMFGAHEFLQTTTLNFRFVTMIPTLVNKSVILCQTVL